MAFTDNIKEITPQLSSISDNTPVLMIGDKFFVNGIGGNFLPSNGTNVVAGYVDSDGNFQPLSFSGTTASNNGTAVSGLNTKIFETGQNEPDYGNSTGSGISINDGMNFLLSFSGTSVPSYTTTGNSCYTIGNPTVETSNGITCLHCNGSGLRIEFENFAKIYNDLNFCVSYWAKGEDLGRRIVMFASQGEYLSSKNLALGSDVNQADTTLAEYTGSTTSWHNYIVNCENGSCVFYVDGSQISSFTLPTPSMTTRTRMFVGGVATSWQYDATSLGDYKENYVANIRVYYKPISLQQISLLKSELTPTNS